MEFEKYRLSQLLTIKNGRDYKSLGQGSVPVFGSGGYMCSVDSYLYDRPSVLLPRKGTLSNIQYYNKGPFWTVDTCYYTIVNENLVDSYYVYRYLRNLNLSGLDTGASIPSMTQKTYNGIKILLPNLSIQHRIASILSTYDSLIENNTKRIRLLEKMAENLYKEWFVRFRFPGHENVEMENGLPKGWKVKKYEDEFNVKYGKGLPTDKLTKDGFPVFGSNGQIGYYTSYMYETPQILISCRGASSGVVNISLPKSFITNNSLICEMTNKTESVFEYLKYCFLNTNLVQYQTGSAQPQITINNIVKLKLLIPSTDVQIKFADKVRILDKEVGNLQHQNSLLARQRDLLLPRLMSGKLEVKEELLE